MMQNLPEMRPITYTQTADTEFRTLLLPASVLLYVEEGSKSVSSSKMSIQCAASGEFVFLQTNAELTMRNCTGSTGNYRAQGLIFEGGGHLQHASCRVEGLEEYRCFSSPIEMVDAFTRLRTAVVQSDLPAQVVHARFFELKAWLTHLGIQLSLPHAAALAQRLRILLASDLSHAWRGSEVAGHLGMSEATLRRGLAREDVCFTEILRETRLQSALERLQTTEQTLSDIAYQTGFSSHSHFTDVFRKRFEFPPSQLRKKSEKGMIGDLRPKNSSKI